MLILIGLYMTVASEIYPFTPDLSGSSVTDLPAPELLKG